MLTAESLLLKNNQVDSPAERAYFSRTEKAEILF